MALLLAVLRYRPYNEWDSWTFLLVWRPLEATDSVFKRCLYGCQAVSARFLCVDFGPAPDSSTVSTGSSTAPARPTVAKCLWFLFAKKATGQSCHLHRLYAFWGFPESALHLVIGLTEAALVATPESVWSLGVPGWFFSFECSRDEIRVSVLWREPQLLHWWHVLRLILSRGNDYSDFGVNRVTFPHDEVRYSSPKMVWDGFDQLLGQPRTQYRVQDKTDTTEAFMDVSDGV